jgi:glucosamine--fructose-6-phosphate aminotransferase (isomerizing)
MCGIIGCALKNGSAAPILHKGLKRLEYRGYDSAGVATIHGGRIHVKKDSGKIDEIHIRLNLNDLPGSIGILGGLLTALQARLMPIRISTVMGSWPWFIMV